MYLLQVIFPAELYIEHKTAITTILSINNLAFHHFFNSYYISSGKESRIKNVVLSKYRCGLGENAATRNIRMVVDSSKSSNLLCRLSKYSNSLVKPSQLLDFDESVTSPVAVFSETTSIYQDLIKL
ncbi:hypothetical protein B566_EDAN010098 [Ephemera danica]|nr:hypothetical protein B566_EDAN010098 [Ephemera danica]